MLPRYMQRAADIERATRRHRRELQGVYARFRERFGADRHEFAARWRQLAQTWDFSEVNELIRQHNEWYPIERDLPMDPRTLDYVPVAGRSYRREELDADWVLRRFPT
jgi:hypothetical protein